MSFAPEDLAQAVRGAAALIQMLGMIGRPAEEGGGDHQLAKVFCENEPEIRTLVTFSLARAGEE